MDVSVVNAGNSKEITLNKTLIEKFHLKNMDELLLEKGYIIKSKVKPGKGWEKEFNKCTKTEMITYLFRMFLTMNPLSNVNKLVG